MKVKVISLPYIFQVLYVLCFTRPRYQVICYRTIDPLVSTGTPVSSTTYDHLLSKTDILMRDSYIRGGKTWTEFLQTRLGRQTVYMSRVMRKPVFCICENKDADQLRGNREADQRLCFRYIDSTIPLLPKTKFQAFSHLLWLYSPVCVRPGQKPQRPFFSQRDSYDTALVEISKYRTDQSLYRYSCSDKRNF